MGVAEHFAGADPAVRDAFEGLVELASVDGPMTVVAQKTRIVLAAPIQVRGETTTATTMPKTHCATISAANIRSVCR